MFRVDDAMCAGCGDCVGVCAPGAITLIEDTATIDDSLCTECGACQEVCPSSAIREVIVPEVVREPVRVATRQRPLAPRAAGVVASIAALAPVAMDIMSRLADRWLGPARTGTGVPGQRPRGGDRKISMRGPGAPGDGLGQGIGRRGRGRGGRGRGTGRRGRWG